MSKSTKTLCYAAMFLALGLVLPFVTGQVPQIGNMLLPMHIPVLLCVLICGWQYGLALGFILPLLRYMLFGMPPLFPNGTAMAFELATYGAVVGWLYNHARWQCVISLYRCLIAAMLAGRLVWGVAEICLLGIGGAGFSWQMFMAEALLNAIPGIILQLILLPMWRCKKNTKKLQIKSIFISKNLLYFICNFSKKRIEKSV